MENFDEDTNLMLEFQKGDDNCFETLVNRHKQRVLNIAYRYLGNVQDAEDVAQQVFINIYKARQRYHPKAQFTTWLYTICKNTCLKTFRRKNLTTISIDAHADLTPGASTLQIADAKAKAPLENIIENEWDFLVKEAVESLPAKQKMVVILYKYEQLSYMKIAEIMRISQKAVKSLLHRARTNLKTKLASYFDK